MVPLTTIPADGLPCDGRGSLAADIVNKTGNNGRVQERLAADAPIDVWASARGLRKPLKRHPYENTMDCARIKGKGLRCQQRCCLHVNTVEFRRSRLQPFISILKPPLRCQENSHSVARCHFFITVARFLGGACWSRFMARICIPAEVSQCVHPSLRCLCRYLSKNTLVTCYQHSENRDTIKCIQTLAHRCYMVKEQSRNCHRNSCQCLNERVQSRSRRWRR